MKEEEKNKIEKLVRIDLDEYENLLISNIKVYKSNIKIAEDDLENALKMYYTFIRDKNKYRVECYKKGDRYIYKKFKRSIGFKNDNSE
jgi:translation initiation factor IF-3